MVVPALKLEGIDKCFPGTQALQNVSFEAYPGKVSALVGANGAGKSTLIKIVSGAIGKDAGTISLNGEKVDISGPAHAQELGISVIYQDFSVLPNLTIAENLFLGREFGKGQFIANRKQSFHATLVMEKVGLKGYDPDILVGNLSNPEKQMVEIAKALSFDSRIILMDEPSAVLTEAELEHLYAQLAILKKQGIAVVFVSHRIDEVLSVSDSNADFMEKKEASHGRIVMAMVGRDLSREPILANVQRSKEPILEVRDLHFGRIVHGVNLSVHGGEIVGLAGLVGSGRTETALCIFGSTPYHKGEIRIKGEVVKFKQPNAAVGLGIGLVPEDRKEQGILKDMTVCENISLAGLDLFTRFGVIDNKREDQNALGFVKSMKIRTPSTKQIVGNLSGGNQQKVVLSKWCSLDADILILDEPTQGIDIGARDEIYHILRSLADGGKAVLIISSDLEEVVKICDRALVMYKGAVVKEFFNSEITEEALLLYSTGGEQEG